MVTHYHETCRRIPTATPSLQKSKSVLTEYQEYNLKQNSQNLGWIWGLEKAPPPQAVITTALCCIQSDCAQECSEQLCLLRHPVAQPSSKLGNRHDCPEHP